MQAKKPTKTIPAIGAANARKGNQGQQIVGDNNDAKGFNYRSHNTTSSSSGTDTVQDL